MRVAAAVGLVLLGTVVLSSPLGGSLVPNLAAWFAIAVVVGLVLPRWWTPFLAAIPWPLLAGIGLLSGRIVFLGEAWGEIALLVFAAGAAGATLGALLARTRSRRG